MMGDHINISSGTGVVKVLKRMAFVFKSITIATHHIDHINTRTDRQHKEEMRSDYSVDW